MSNNLQPTPDDYIKNFPIPTLRKKQSYVLKEIDAALASGYNHIVVEAPTGFGKSPVAIAVALTLGTSYICTSTKDLQTQYTNDFPFVKVAKGKNNFTCEVKEDFIRNDTYRCGLCVKVDECYHTSADYGPCMSNRSFMDDGCKYRTFPKHYKIINKGTKEENVIIDYDARDNYQKEYSQWLHLENLRPEQREWRPCEYFHQLNIALTSSHSILNYPMFLSLLPTRKFRSGEILILDEAHLLETEIVKFTGISISKRRWRRYLSNFKIVDYGYNDIEKWIDFLIDLETKMSELDIPEELVPDVIADTERLKRAIGDICSNPKNWIVSEMKKEGDEVVSVELKPLDVSPYCKWVFRKCNKTLMMSATILDSKTFCKSLGLSYDEVKFIQVGSDFPLQNRTIYPMNTAYLNFNNLRLQEVKTKTSRAVDDLMTLHRNHKGIIHTTSYKQLNFIKENISQTNKRRLLETDPEIPRDEVISEHANSLKPTVLISPSLHLGLDLKDDLSRFQIITKVPYPDLGDRWINENAKLNQQWYNWQTALRLVQGYGRSIRSKEDWAKTYVLDSAFGPFVNKNKIILPGWDSQAIQPDLLKAPLGGI